MVASSLNVGGEFRLKGISLVQPTSGKTITVPIASPGVIVAPTGPMDLVTLIFPKKAQDGTIVFISFTQNIKHVAVVNAQMANKSLTSGPVSAGTSTTLFYHAKTDKWYKLI